MSDSVSDDLVASILLKDAEARAQRSQKDGVHAFLADPATGRLAGLAGTGLSSRPGKPKPNTRFLANIVKEVQGHNRALLKKEEEDAKRRLRGLRGILDGNDREKGLSSKRRKDSRSERRSRSRSPHRSRNPRRERSRSKERHRNRSRSRDRRRESRRKDREDESSRGRSRSRSSKRRDRSRSHSRSRRKRRRTRSPSRSRSRSKSRKKVRRPSTERYKPRHRRTERHSPTPSRSSSRSLSPPSHSKLKSSRSKKPERASESPHPPKRKKVPSDYGPSPPPQPRGRGVPTGGSKMDDHFAEGYDPSADVDLSSDGWEDAVSAFRDRQKFKQLGGERLRAAGFTEEQIRRWEGKEEREVKWATKAEGREWDRGKVWMDEGDGKSGSWAVKASWDKDDGLPDY